MKQRLIMLFTTAFIGCSLSVSSQTASTAVTLNKDVVERKLQKTEEATSHPKKGIKAKTWLQRGEALTEAANVGVDLLRMGMAPSEVMLYYQKPVKSEQVTKEDGTVRKIEYYDNAKLVYENDQLVYWEQINPMVEMPLKKALDAYDKMVELDPEKSMEKKLKDNLIAIKANLETKGILAYNEKDYKDAFYYFDQYVRAGDFYVFEGARDTIIFFNAALAANNAGLKQEAAKYYNQAISLGYGGETPYLHLKELYLSEGDSTLAVETLQRGFKELEENNTLVVELVNFYLLAGNAEQALDYLTIAKEAEPNNKSYHFAEGTLQDKMGSFNEAAEAYKKAIEIDPAYFDAYYNLAVLHYNEAVEIFNKANETKDNNEYERLRKESTEHFEKAVPYLERAHEIKPDDVDTLETLKTLYYRLQNKEKLEEVNKKLDELKG